MESGEGGSSGVSTGGIGQPGGSAYKVEGGRTQQMEEACFGAAAVARPPEVAPADPLGARAFDSRP